jgi:hypothetical protein
VVWWFYSRSQRWRSLSSDGCHRQPLLSAASQIHRLLSTMKASHQPFFAHHSYEATVSMPVVGGGLGHGINLTNNTSPVPSASVSIGVWCFCSYFCLDVPYPLDLKSWSSTLPIHHSFEKHNTKSPAKLKLPSIAIGRWWMFSDPTILCKSNCLQTTNTADIIINTPFFVAGSSRGFFFDSSHKGMICL